MSRDPLFFAVFPRLCPEHLDVTSFALGSLLWHAELFSLAALFWRIWAQVNTADVVLEGMEPK